MLAFAVHQSSDAQVNLHVVGWILMGVGLIGLLPGLAWWERWGPGYWSWHRNAYDVPPSGGTYGRGYGRRRRVVEEDLGGPAPGPGPYDAPPPP